MFRIANVTNWPNDQSSSPSALARRKLLLEVKQMTDKKTPHAPAHGFDGAGHMDPAHKKRLLELSREGKTEETTEAFVKKSHTHDDLAEELAESAVASMTSGEEQLRQDLDAEVAEERGGPFVKTNGSTEFAEGTDESNIAEATREPFPTT
jgi:hypothetical protein